ncbi:uncharacterized protein FOMMEDRAFT_97970 [Fomitiporia mediterranea MF3/22]|uniref:uncharacterized protein n=1 Tax=Fomitiporia mediterranea (strain MF3/22) TaxID=694068 RepID=UPI0004409508|nr:uncharacterized protein FOMMEDRAFT_97970 [Fomitiporia mediterranea MF3/22]EJC98092.1 hypothetical protein FOMMEDRAFT_97970 [Fomitiporia mediterranea MF3/22]
MQAQAGDEPSHSKPIDFSQSGIVHLPPVSSHSASESGGSSLSGGSLVSSRKARDNIQSPFSGSGSDPWGRSDRGKDSAGEGTQSGGLSGTDSAGDAVGATPSSMNMSSSSELVTFRFEHVVDEDGFHVITGREGVLTKCEDEPIHAPGAVQGFGVLIAVQEDDNTGNLIVRQVSENATEILGLSPRYLFNLECFTQTLPDSQADLLWDNVQFLNDSEFSEGEQGTNDNPQVFLLSGWGEPGSAPSDEDEEIEREGDRRFWTCWCAAHRPPLRVQANANMDGKAPGPFERSIIILEFELERDLYNPLYPPFQSDVIPSDSGSTTEMYASPGPTVKNTAPLSSSTEPSTSDVHTTMLNPAELFLAAEQGGLEGEEQWFPRPEDVFESTTSHAKPLKALERMRRINRTFSNPGTERSGLGAFETAQTRKQRARARRGAQTGVGTMDIFAVLAQVNDQLSSAPDLESFLKVVVGVIKDLTQFHRVLVYQFDEQYNGQVVAELVDWRQTHELYKGLHFPASDVPAQACQLYKINKVRLLYNRSQATARLVVRGQEDLETPLDMTHSFLRAMSPIHIKYIANMGVRSSMSISIVTFGALWGLISCHSYGVQGMRVSFPVRQMLRLLSDSISRNIERLSYAQRLLTRKLISTLPTDSHPTGYIVSNAEDLLSLFDADFGVLVIGDGAKILGPNQHGQEILLVAEYLRLKQFTLLQVSQSVVKDFPDLQLPSGLEVIAGLLYVPLSRGGKDFIAFLRKGQLRDVHWAGKPYKDYNVESVMEPRKSFKTWSETVAGRCRAWTEEQMETAGVLALVYGKFIEVWRQKESALQTTQLTNILLSNASHEVRTPLNHIINYLEMALNGPLDTETRENLSRSHSASKSLLFTINDLLDLTRLESGNETYFNEPFNLHETIADAVQLYRNEATRRNVQFDLDISSCPKVVVGDAKKIRTVVANLTANAVKFTTEGKVTVSCHKFEEPRGLRNSKEVAVEIVVGDTGCGIESARLENIFQVFEQVETSISRSSDMHSLGLGLAVVARIVEQLGGQLRVDSKPNEGSRFSFLIPFELPPADNQGAMSPAHSSSSIQSLRSRKSSDSSEIDGIVEALQSDHMKRPRAVRQTRERKRQYNPRLPAKEGTFNVADSRFPIKSLKVDEFDVDKSVETSQIKTMAPTPVPLRLSPPSGTRSPAQVSPSQAVPNDKLRVLVVEDDHINRTILTKRLTLDGHTVVGTRDGLEGVEAVKSDGEFDCILMDIQMPILNGFEAAKAIRELPLASASSPVSPGKIQARKSKDLNGGRIPIFAVSASLPESQREEMLGYGIDGWILKPIEFKRLRKILSGILHPDQRETTIYKPGVNWEDGGWFERARSGQ